MCGITGIARYNQRELAEERVRLMNQSIAHRGPDAEGMWSNELCVLGHRRLSIIDTSAQGNQPFHFENDRLVVVFNGEIYNYLELKTELSAGFSFQTQTDTEVIIAAYLKWGIDCVSHFFGMFAFALYDRDAGRVMIARDRLGVKPLYYAHTNDGLVFASEIRAILSTGLVKKKIAHAALCDYLRYQTVHAPATMIEGVHMLMPGHIMLIDADGHSIQSYWGTTTHRASISPEITKAEVQRNVEELLTSSVELRMRADVPFGAFLSGGIDSSIVVGLMSRISEHRVKTFSITFHEKEFDESPYSDLIAQKFKTDHTPIRLRATDFLELIPDALHAMDHPSGDGANTFVVSKVTREAGVKMALSGLGGDEVFAGYDVFKRMKALEQKAWLNLAPKVLRKSAGALLRSIKPSVATEKLALALGSDRMDPEHLYPLTRQILFEDDIQRLTHSSTNIENVVKTLSASIFSSDLPLLSKVSVMEMETYMQNTLLRDADQMSMAHALEIRVPFLDHRLVEYVLGVSDTIKYPHTPKELLTSSVGDLIPREIIDRPKMGFTFPWALWMRSELKTFCETQLQALQSVEALNHAEVMALWKRFMNNDKHITWSRIWPLVVLGHWVKQHDIH
ncbi:MAG: asparagine synthase (glutamine-hydrolyzing) [Flavobacteriales bacterium]|jgi:asparagine synthase (glutamine-hydrolysing)